MNDVTRILSAVEGGDAQAAAQLLPLVSDELRKLAAQRLAQGKPGQTLQATALVHEAYLRLVGGDPDRIWNGRAHAPGGGRCTGRRAVDRRGRLDLCQGLAEAGDGKNLKSGRGFCPATAHGSRGGKRPWTRANSLPTS